MPWAKPRKAAKHFDVSVRTIWNWLGEGMPSVKVNGHRLIKLEDADRWLEENFSSADQTEKIVDGLMKGLG